ncbi:unnamed protein product, partial [Linum tenue]
YEVRAEKLKEEAKLIFAQVVADDDLVAKLELVDSVRKLGLASFFEDEIKEGLDHVVSFAIGKPSSHMKHSLHFCALSFRLLRQHGYHVSQDIFSEFVDKPTRSFMESKCCGDTLGLVELFEASHLGLEHEDIMEEANRFSARILKSSYPSLLLHHDKDLAECVAHALELPIHWRVQWFDVKWHIKVHEKRKKVDRALIDLAKVNFNVVQSALQKDLRQIASNGSVSSSGTVIAVHSFFSVLNSNTTRGMKGLSEKNHHHLIHNVCLIIRLCNDIGTSKVEQERGEVASSSIACYMREANTTEEKAKDHIKGLITKVWKKINEQCFGRQPPMITPGLFVDITTNMARVAHNLYQHGDGFGGQDHKHHHKKQILSLLVHPLKLESS